MNLRALLPCLIAAGFAACHPLEHPTPADGGASDAGVRPDAGAPDAGERDLDYRQTRGAPWTLHEGPALEGRPFAVSANTFALETSCDGGACDFEWRDDDGALINRREHLRGLFGNNLPRGGHVASLYDIRSSSTCIDALGSTHEFLEGDWHLLDVNTGASVANLPSVASMAFLDSAFLRSGLHARLLLGDSGRCAYTPLLRSTSAPYGMPPGQAHLDEASWVEDELRDGRLLVSKAPEALVVLDPASPAILMTISDQATSVRTTNGFAHVFERQPVQAVVSYEYATHRKVRTELPFAQRDHLERAVSGRSFVLCGGNQPLTRCEVRDGRGELAPSELEVSKVNSSLQLAVAGEAGIVVWAKSGQVLRRNLITGMEDVVSEVPATVRTVANGGGVLMIVGTTALAVDATRVRPFPGRLTAVVDTGGDLAQAQTVMIIGTSEAGGEVWLTAWHVESGRLARLTDSLNFNPPFNAPLTAADRCNAPGFVRNAGNPGASAFVDASLLHFTEFIAQGQPVVRLFVMPLDLSAAPRLVAEVAPDRCGTPLLSRDGTRLWFPSPSGSAVKATWATP